MCLWRGQTFFISAKYGACSSYYMHAWSDRIVVSLLFRTTVKILNLLKYFDLYKLAHRMDTNLVLKTISFHQNNEVYWKKTVVRDCFVFYKLPSSQVCGLAEESVQTRRRVRVLTVFLRPPCCRLFYWPSMPVYDVSSWHRAGQTMMIIVSRVMILVRPSTRG